MTISELINILEVVAPPSLQEDYDNAGLITGSASWECTGIIISLDSTEVVVQEAIDKKCNLVVAHHPIVFKGLRKITGKNYVERTIIKAIKNDIAIYAIHTNLDNVIEGVNGKIADLLGLINRQILKPKKDLLQKLVVFVPTSHKEAITNALFAAGAGDIGDYSECSFSTDGSGSFKAGSNTNPYVGEKGERHLQPESRVEVIFPGWNQAAVLKAMKATHPYEEVAFDIYHLENAYAKTGSGMIGDLQKSISEDAFLLKISGLFNIPVIKHTRLLGKPIKTVALCGGAGSFLIKPAIQGGADIYLTGDVKYHEFFDANDRLVLADIGHYESEQFTITLLFDILREKFPNFAVLKTGVYTNPVCYFTRKADEGDAV